MKHSFLIKNATPVFVGTIVEPRRRPLAGLITATRDTDEYEHPLKVLHQTLIGRFAVNLAHRTVRETQVDHEHLQLRWRGSVRLASEKAE